jgi:zinc finger protein 830
MADVRSMLKTERAARKIQHKHASYAPTGTLLCTACRLQLKSDTLWEGHLRSAGHIMRLQKLEDSSDRAPPAAPESTPSIDGNKRKRRASEDEETIRKRTKAANGLPEGSSDTASEPEPGTRPIQQLQNRIQIPSRPATPLKSAEAIPELPSVNEDEWAAFEADIAATEVSAAAPYDDSVISAPAMSAADLAAKDKQEEHNRRREKQEAELEGDKEDAARRMEDELQEIEGLEQRVKKLKDMREALRGKSKAGLAEVPGASTLGGDTSKGHTLKNEEAEEAEEEEEEDEEDEDDWVGFRMKG